MNNDGRPVEHRLRRHHARFEFFAVERHDETVRYYMFDEPDELVCERADQELEPFRFLRRSWRKPADHRAVLTANYGDWRVPRAGWHFADAGTMVHRRPARFGEETWDGARL